MRVTKSDIDQLVVGYVSEQRYFETRNKLFQESPNLPEKVPILSVFGDISSDNRLHTILDEYVQFKTKQLLPICAVCDEQVSISDLWKMFDRIINKIRNYKEASPQKLKPPQELRRYSPTQFILDSNKSKSVNEASEPKAIQRKILNPFSNEYEPESIIGPKQTEPPTRCLESGRRKKTTMPRRFNNSNNNIPIAPFNNNQPVLLAYNGDLSRLLNLPDNNDALALVGCEILKNMKKCAEKGGTSEPPPEISTSIAVTNEATQPPTPMKNQDAPTLDIDDLISDETRGGLVEMTIDSLLNPEYEGLPDMTTSSVNNVEEDFSELRKLLDLDDSSSSRLTLPDLIQTKQDEKYLIEIINAPNDKDLPEDPIPMDFDPQNNGAPAIQICEQKEDEKFYVDDMLPDTNSASTDIVAVATSALIEAEMSSVTASVTNTITVSSEIAVAMTTDDVTSSHDFVNEDCVLRTAPPIYTTADSQSVHVEIGNAENMDTLSKKVEQMANIADDNENNNDFTHVQNTQVEVLIPANKQCIVMPPKKRFLAKEGTTPTKSCNSDARQNLDSSALTGELQIDEASDVEATSANCVLNNISPESNITERLHVDESTADGAKEQEKSDSSKNVTEIDHISPKKGIHQKKPKFSLKDIVGKRKKKNSPTNNKSSEVSKNNRSDEHNETLEPGVRVMKPGHGSVVINLKDRGRMPIHVKGIVVHNEKNKSISKEDIINQLVGQMHQPGDSESAESQKNVCDTQSKTTNETVSKTVDPELNSSQNINISQYLSVQSSISSIPQGQNTNFISLLSTPPKLSYSEHFSTISPSAGIFSVISSNTNRSHLSSPTTSTPNQFSEARSNLLESFIQQEQNVSCVRQQYVTEGDHDNIRGSEYAELATVTLSQPDVVQHQTPQNTSGAAKTVNLATMQKTGGAAKNRNKMNMRKSTAPQKVAKKQNRSIFLCSKMKNMVKIEPKKYGAPAIRKCILGTTPNQPERNIDPNSQVMNVGAMETTNLPPLAPVNNHDTASQSQPIDFDQFFDFGNDTPINNCHDAENLQRTTQTENSAQSHIPSEKLCQNYQNHDLLQCSEKLPPSPEMHGEGANVPNDDKMNSKKYKKVTNHEITTGEIKEQLETNGNLKQSSERKAKKSQRKKERSLSREERKKRKRSDAGGSPIMKWSYEKIQAKLNAIHSSQRVEFETNESSHSHEKDSLQSDANSKDATKYADCEVQQFSKKKCSSSNIQESEVPNIKGGAVKRGMIPKSLNFETQENLTPLLDVPIKEKNRGIETYLSQYEAEKESAINSIIQSKDDSIHSIYTRPVFQMEPLDLSLSGWPQSPQKNTFMSLTAAETNILSMASQRNLDDTMPHASAPQTTTSSPAIEKEVLEKGSGFSAEVKLAETEKSVPSTNKENILRETSTSNNFTGSVLCSNTENQALTTCKTKLGSSSKQGTEPAVLSEQSQNTFEEKVKVRKKKRSHKKKDRLSMLMNLSQEEIQARLDLLHCGGETPRHDSSLYEDSSNSKHNDTVNMSPSKAQKGKTHQQTVLTHGVDENSNSNVNSIETVTSTAVALHHVDAAEASNNFHRSESKTRRESQEMDVKEDHSLLPMLPVATLMNVKTPLEVPKQKIKSTTKRKSPSKAKSSGKVSKHKKSKKLEKLKNLDIQKFLASIHYDE